MTNQYSQMPVIFVPHGGGPMPLMGDSNHRELTQFLQRVSDDLPQPKAIVVVTAHWEENVVSVSSKASPTMLFDYYGFPPETYDYKYPAAGDPALAQLIVDLFSASAIQSKLDSVRGFDHGTFVPLMLMYPQADIPVVQISLLNNLNPAEHIKLGKALAPLREQGVLIVGSGMSFHNMQAFFSTNPNIPAKSEAFDDWLTDTLTSSTLTQEQRIERLTEWKSAPEARFCHPREEHLLPLHVCFGAASQASSNAIKPYSGYLFNTKISAFSWF